MRFVAVTVVTVALLGGALSGCTVSVAGNAIADRGAVAAAPEAVPDPRTGAFGDPEGRFELVPPSGWVVDTSGASGTAALFLNPKPTPTTAGSFTANINVLIVPNAAELTATVRDARQEVTSVQGYLPVEDAPFVLADGTPGYLLGGRFSDPAGFALRNVQLFTVRGDRTIVVTGTAPADTWDEYAPVFDSALHTVTAGP
jgi:hypothetical protein